MQKRNGQQVVSLFAFGDKKNVFEESGKNET